MREKPETVEEARTMLIDAAKYLAARETAYFCEGPFRRLYECKPTAISCTGVVAWAAHRTFGGALEDQLIDAGIGTAEAMWNSEQLEHISPCKVEPADLVFFKHREKNGGCYDWHVMMLVERWSIVGACSELEQGPDGHGCVVQCDLLSYRRKTRWKAKGIKRLPFGKLLNLAPFEPRWATEEPVDEYQ